MKRIDVAAAGLAAVSALALAGAASADCKLAEIAEFHVDPGDATPIVNGEINGHPVKVAFDIGAATSIIPYSEAKRLGVTVSRLEGVRMYGFGGDTAAYDATVKELKIGSFTVGAMRFVAAGDPDAKSDVSLLLGDDFFSRTDVEFDLRDGFVRLFEPHDCTPPQLVYWGQSYSQATLLPWDRDSPTTQTMASINGKPILAEFDTGAETSLVDEGAAEAAGVTRPPNATTEMGRGLGPRHTESWTAHLDSVALGDEKLSNVRLQVMNFAGGMAQSETGYRIPHHLGSTPYLFIGADFFHAHRVFIDNKDRLVLFSYEGGPVFAAAAPPPPSGR